MRPIEKKILEQILKKGLTLYQIEEIIDSTSRQEMKKSYPDDSHFQSSKYFAKNIAKTLLRLGLIKQEGNKYINPNPPKKS